MFKMDSSGPELATTPLAWQKVDAAFSLLEFAALRTSVVIATAARTQTAYVDLTVADLEEGGKSATRVHLGAYEEQ